IHLPPVRLAPGGKLDEALLELILANVRTPQERRGDLEAQRGACAAGSAGWRALLAREGAPRMKAACDALLDYTERRARAKLRQLGEVKGAAEDMLEGDGVSDTPVPFRVKLHVKNGTLHLDFDGTSPRVRGNVNTPRAVCRAAAIFVLRSLLDDDVPT